MKRLSIILMLLILGLTLQAQEMTSHEKAAERLLEATKSERLMDATMQNMLDLQVESNPQMAPMRSAMEAFFEKYISYKSVKSNLIALYVESFTEDELNTIADFYGTPTGKKAITVMPDVMAKSMKIGQQRVQDNMQELQLVLMNAMAEHQAASDSSSQVDEAAETEQLEEK